MVDGAVVVVCCVPHAVAGPIQVPGGTTGWLTVVDVEVVVVGALHVDPLSLLLAEPDTASEPVQFVVTVTEPAGRGTEKVCVEPCHVKEVGVPLMVTVAEFVPVDGNDE